MLKSHEITEVVQRTHTLTWDNGVSAKVEYIGDKISNYNFFNGKNVLFPLNILNVDDFFYNMREELKHKIELNSLNDVKEFNSFDKLYGIKSNMLFDASCKIYKTFMDITVHVNLTCRQLERILNANKYIKSLFVISEYRESYSYPDESDDNCCVIVLKLKFASDDAMVKVLGSNDVRKLEFIDRIKISNIIKETLNMGS